MTAVLLGFLLGQAWANLPQGKQEASPTPPYRTARPSEECARGTGSRLEAARACIRAGNYALAERKAEEAKDDTPSDPEVYETLAWAALKQNKFGPAARSSEAAAELDNKRARPYVLLAFAKELGGDRQGMLENLDAAARLDSRYGSLLSGARRNAMQRVFRPAGWASARPHSDGIVISDEKALADPGTPDAFFLEGELESAYAKPGLTDALIVLGALGLTSLLAGLLARRAWTARKSWKGAGARPPDFWESLLELIGSAFSLLDQRFRRGPPAVAGAPARGNAPRSAPPSTSTASQPARPGGTPFRRVGTPMQPTRPAARLPLQSGQDPRSKYEQVRILGSNEDGVLWEGFDKSLQRSVAIEELAIPKGDGRREAALARARELGSLQHPAILDLFEVADLGDKIWLIFELLEGRTLRDRITEAGRLTLDEARDILLPVCEALEFAHERGLLHRHVKPSRIILAEAGYVKLTGFEVLLDMERGRRYLAPEAERGQATQESDIFSLGACLYEMLSGRSPFRDADADAKARGEYVPVTSLVPDLPAGVDALLAMSLSPFLETRCPTVTRFIEALRGVETLAAQPQAQGQRLASPKPAWWIKLRKSSRRGS